MDYLFNISLFILVALILVINELINNNEYKGAMKSNVHTLNMFQSYTKKFNKTYTDSEFLQRLKNFEESLEEISRLNKLHDDANVFGLTQFSDWSTEEFSETMLSGLALGKCDDQHLKCTLKAHRRNKNESIYNYDLPKQCDWRIKKDVFPVLDQKLCAGCWAFSIVGAMESRAAIHGKGKIRRSIQEVLDCSAYNRGCYKGDIRLGLEYLCRNNYPVVTEKEYPLTLRDEACMIPKGPKPKGLRIAEFTNACFVNEPLTKYNVILREIAINGPVVAAVNALPWKNYNGGVLKTACKGTWESLNHAIQIVGYDLTAPDPYYIIRNSWGKYFGDHGYVKLAIGMNICGITNNVAYFTVS